MRDKRVIDVDTDPDRADQDCYRADQVEDHDDPKVLEKPVLVSPSG